MRKNQILFNITAFLMAFCSVSYEILIASRLSRILGEGMFLYPACIAVFILFMGLGSAFWYRRAGKAGERSIGILLLVELSLTLFGAISILFINLCLFASIYAINIESIIFGFVFAALIGFLSGQELPLIFHFCGHLGLPQKNVRRIIFFDYLASFFASVMCVLVFFSTFGFFKTSILVAILNLVVVILILIIMKVNDLNASLRRTVSVIVLLFSLAFTALVPKLDKIENAVLKHVYLGYRHGILLEKRYTPYQQVLLFAMRHDYEPITHSKKEILAHPGDYYLFAILNGSLQFFEPLDIDADPDHTYLFDPFLQLMPGLENALILGGGDGLPARQAVRYGELKNITMVDIDEEWVTFAKNDPFMRKKNRKALSNKRVKIHYADAFKWVLKTRDKYDIIVVDFPSEPSSLAKIRTNSIQFFRDLKRILSDKGVAVLHSNSLSSFEELDLYAKTARKAGLFAAHGFKQGSRTWSEVEQIVLFPSEDARGAFLDNYSNFYLTAEQMAPTVKRFGLITYRPLDRGAQWISFYDPLVSRLPLQTKLKFMKDALYE